MEGEDAPCAIPASAAGPWMTSPKYSRYKQHYEEMQRWMGEYAATMKQLHHSGGPSDQYHNSPSGYKQPSIQPGMHHPDHLGDTRRGTNRRNLRKLSLRSKRRANYVANNHHKNTNNDDDMDWSEETGEDDKDNYELEISEEFKQFFAKTEEFRRQREKARAKGQVFTGELVKNVKDSGIKPADGLPVESVGMKMVDDNQGKPESEVTCSESESQEDVMTSAPKERPGVRRIAEMKELYGRHAAAIHGMETAIQLQFDRHYDRKKPALWPIVPLKM